MPASQTPTAKPSAASHLLALIMPFTMVVLVPWWLLSTYRHHAFAWLLPLAGLLFAGGLVLFGWTLLLFVRVGRGTLAPWDPTKKLIITGPYRHCRNPMISGVLLMILGESAAFGSWALLMWALAFYAINTIYFVAVEEQTLAQKFGEQYLAYKKHVPRWLPRFKSYQS